MIEVIASADPSVSLPLAVLVANLEATATPDRRVSLTVLVPKGAVSLVVRHAEKVDRKNLEFTVVEVPSAMVSSAKTEEHLPVAAYYRVLAAELLPHARVIHLDLDTLILEPLSELWGYTLHGRPLAAVRNITTPFVASGDGVQSWKDRGLDPRTPYFNSGVMVLDLEAWREENHGEAVMRIARSGAEKYADQGALNAHFAGNWEELPLRWNQHSSIHRSELGLDALFEAHDLEAARTRPAIVHFVGPQKPWLASCQHPHAERWRGIAQRVGPPGWRPWRDSRWTIAKRRLAKAILALRTG